MKPKLSYGQSFKVYVTDSFLPQGTGAPSCLPKTIESPVPAQDQENTAPTDDLIAPSGLVDLTLYAPRWLLRFLWWYVLFYQVGNTVLLGGLSYMYLTARTRDSMLWFLRANFLFARAARFLDQVSDFVCVAYLVFALFFMYGACCMLHSSIIHRRLCYGMRKPTVRRDPIRLRDASWFQIPLVLWRGLVRIWESFGVRGKYFASGLIVRESMEVALQTIQANSSAQQISNPFVNHSYAVLIFINCCSSYLYGYLFRADQAHRRLACVLTDLTLDFLWGTVIPVILFMPYVRLYMNRHQVDNSVMTESVQSEVEQMLVLSLKAFILSIFPFVSSIGSLRGIKRLLEYAKTRRPPGARMQRPSISIESVMSRLIRLYLKHKSWTHLAHAMMVFHGIFILVVSVFSSGVFWTFPDIPFDCIHRVYPWFSRAEACGGRIINCTHAGISGNKSEFTAALELFDDASLEFLIVLNCPNLQLPSTIRRFHQLNTLKIANATISEWNEDASLSTGAFPVIMTLRLWNITLECSPYGLYRVPVSTSLEWFSFENIDLSGFIGEVGSNWKDLQYVYLDATHIDQVPEAVATMSKALELSLRFNAISVVNSSRLTSLNQLTGLWFDGNPITALPDEAWRHNAHLQEFGFQYTSVATYPLWANSVTNKELQINGFDSPLCDPSNKAYAVGKLDYLACIENFYGYN